MRITSKEPNILRLFDNISGTKLHLHFDMPSSQQVAKYTNGMTKRIRNKIVNCTGENRLNWGGKILRGWREGDFGYEKKVEGGKPEVVVVSSAPGSPDYREDWKEWFCKHNADLVERLAIHAFELTSEEDDSVELEENKDPN